LNAEIILPTIFLRWPLELSRRSQKFLTTMHYDFIPYCLKLLHTSVSATILENCYKTDIVAFKQWFSFLYQKKGVEGAVGSLPWKTSWNPYCHIGIFRHPYWGRGRI